MRNRGFTLIELLFVMTMIALFASLMLASFSESRAKSHDARRVSEMQSIKKALELYYIDNRNYPPPDVDGCGGWDVGNATLPLFYNVNMAKYFAGNTPPVDIWRSGNCQGYTYYRYPAGSFGCIPERGDFYVLGIRDMETSDVPYPESPGWSCKDRNWQDEFDWVTGDYSN